jgi:hypothetical protein
MGEDGLTTARAVWFGIMAWPRRTALAFVTIAGGAVLTGWGLRAGAGLALSTSVIVAAAGGFAVLGLATAVLDSTVRTVFVFPQFDSLEFRRYRPLKHKFRPELDDAPMTVAHAVRVAASHMPRTTGLFAVVVVGGAVLTGWGLRAGAGLALSTSVIVAAAGGLAVLGLAVGTLTLVFRAILFLADLAGRSQESAAGPQVHRQGNIPTQETATYGWAALETDTTTDTDPGDASEVWE